MYLPNFYLPDKEGKRFASTNYELFEFGGESGGGALQFAVGLNLKLTVKARRKRRKKKKKFSSFFMSNLPKQ